MGVPGEPTPSSRSARRCRARASTVTRPGPQSQSIQALIERAALAAGDADQTIAELQDSMLPVEVGDTELRAGLAQTREALGAVPTRARDLVRIVGR